MPFTSANIAAMEFELKRAAGALLAPQQVDLYQGPTVTVKLHVSSRRANERDVSGGAVADTQLIATIDADDWDMRAGRPPQKGDVIWWTGERHAVERSAPSSPAGNKAFYKARLTG
jgi:hypothetical protein